MSESSDIEQVFNFFFFSFSSLLLMNNLIYIFEKYSQFQLLEDIYLSDIKII